MTEHIDERLVRELGVRLDRVGKLPHLVAPVSESLDEGRDVREVDDVEADQGPSQAHSALKISDFKYESARTAHPEDASTVTDVGRGVGAVSGVVSEGGGRRGGPCS